MSENEIGRFIYLLLLLIVIGGYFLLSSRRRMGKIMQQASIWGLIFVGFAAGYALWDDIRGTSAMQTINAEEQRIEVAQSFDGHYHLNVDVNGTEIEFIVDTGATDIVLSRVDAARAGIDLDSLRYIGSATTANGAVRTAPVRLDRVELGPIQDSDIRAWVNEGDLDISLLGMSYLQRFDTVSFSQGRLVLQR